MKKVPKIVLIVFLSLYVLIGLIINPWCITRSMRDFGMKEILPYDVQNASIIDNKVLLLETDTLIRIGREKHWHQSSATIKMRCDLNASLDFPKNITDEIRNRQYSNIPGLLGRQFHNIAETEQIFYAKYAQCNLENDDITLSGEKLQLVTDDLLEKKNAPQKTFLYIAGSFKYHPMHKYLIIYNEQDIIIVPISFEGQRQSHQTWVRPFRYALYPFTIVLDIATHPIQICQMLASGGKYFHCPEWTGGP